MRDVLIIGAGPAGSIAAVLFARAGYHVTLAEQHRFPRDKVCGECLSSTGFDVLMRCGLRESFDRLSPARLNRTILHAPDGESILLSLPKPMWGISRSSFDAWLLTAATRAGATILQPARCESLTPGDPPSARLRLLESNETIDHTPSLILLADGKGAFLPTRPPITPDFGIKAHFNNVNGPRDAIEMFGVGDHYGGLAPIENDRTNAAFSVPAALITEARGNIDALFDRLSRRNSALRHRLAGATRCGPWLAAPLPRFQVSHQWPRGIIPLGNSAAALEPIGGEGIGLAMRSAEIAIEAILRGETEQLPAQFKRLWRTRSISCRAIAKLLSSSTWSGPTMELARTCPFAVPVTMQLLGKG
ncbi:MAG TPA: NAD(P)/FAD-dependent oxidoreductase [Tepidisphaeraceae bacterium]|jgi:flavin-dependent dehydrogenase|nr:NAD(P)/FAD-dependent oxidoreductase [Tepidisphaeraceae bacterium]